MRRAGAIVALLLTTSAAAQRGPVFRSGIDLVTVGVTVTDRKGGLVTNLTAADFEIREDGRPQTITYFAPGAATDSADGPPLHLGVLLDVSESMGDDLSFSKTASIKFLNRLVDAEDITIVDFDTEVRAARFSQAEFPRVVERIRQKTARGETALYDAIGVYLDGAAEQDGRKVMLVYTDGGDTRSAMRYGELLDLLKASDVTIYAIGELEHQSASVRSEQRRILQQIADTTGGAAFFPLTVNALEPIYDKVVAEVRAQYTIGYQSTNQAADGAWRKLEIAVRGKDMKARSRKGYFAPFKRQ